MIEDCRLFPLHRKPIDANGKPSPVGRALLLAGDEAAIRRQDDPPVGGGEGVGGDMGLDGEVVAGRELR